MVVAVRVTLPPLAITVPLVADGAVPLVVYRMVAPDVAQAMVTLCEVPKVSGPSGVKVGAATATIIFVKVALFTVLVVMPVL